MVKNNLCDACDGLLRRHGMSAHPQLVPRSQIVDHTIYRCRSCRGLLEHSALTGRWVRLPLPLPLPK